MKKPDIPQPKASGPFGQLAQHAGVLVHGIDNALLTDQQGGRDGVASHAASEVHDRLPLADADPAQEADSLACLPGCNTLRHSPGSFRRRRRNRTGRNP